MEMNRANMPEFQGFQILVIFWYNEITKNVNINLTHVILFLFQDHLKNDIVLISPLKGKRFATLNQNIPIQFKQQQLGHHEQHRLQHGCYRHQQ